MNRRIKSTRIIAKISELTISTRTVQRRLIERKLYSRRPAKKQ